MTNAQSIWHFGGSSAFFLLVCKVNVGPAHVLECIHAEDQLTSQFLASIFVPMAILT